MSKSEFVQIIKDNEWVIYKITRAFSFTGDDQKDLYQEIVYQLWKSFAHFREQSKVSTWMYRVALNTAITYKKKVGKSRAFHSSIVPDDIIHYDNEDTEQKLQLLYQSIYSLSDIDKGIILLYLEGKNYEDISSITGFTVSNIGTRLSRIKQKLKSKIKSTHTWN